MTEVERPTPVAAEMKAAASLYVDAFERFVGNGAASVPNWLRDRQRQAINEFAELGFPTTRQEGWRFTDVKAIARADFALAPAVDASTIASSVRQYVVGGGNQHVAVFVNGYFAPSLSSVDRLPAGVRLGSLREALDDNVELVKPHLAQLAETGGHPFATLNTAFLHDGALVYVPERTVVEQPMHLLFLSAPVSGSTAVSHPRALVVVEPGAQASVIESYAATDSHQYWTNAVTEVVVGQNAKLDTYRIQRESTAAYHTATTRSVQARDSVFSLIAFTFGSQLSRHDIHAVLDGEGSECTIDGLSMLRERQHSDYHTVLEHAQPHCNSWEYFNGVFDGRSRGVFNGRIIVRPGAQKTDSKQTNNNLLLSQHARADSQPQLEIYADDVRCTHGATLGPMDDDHLFYLQSRGLSRAEARALLTYGFGSEILNAVKIDTLRTDLDRLVRARLAEDGSPS
jgi:Fe-S cluster assembly protein SufD